MAKTTSRSFLSVFAAGNLVSLLLAALWGWLYFYLPTVLVIILSIAGGVLLVFPLVAAWFFTYPNAKESQPTWWLLIWWLVFAAMQGQAGYYAYYFWAAQGATQPLAAQHSELEAHCSFFVGRQLRADSNAISILGDKERIQQGSRLRYNGKPRKQRWMLQNLALMPLRSDSSEHVAGWLCAEGEQNENDSIARSSAEERLRSLAATLPASAEQAFCYAPYYYHEEWTWQLDEELYMNAAATTWQPTQSDFPTQTRRFLVPLPQGIAAYKSEVFALIWRDTLLLYHAIAFVVLALGAWIQQRRRSTANTAATNAP